MPEIVLRIFFTWIILEVLWFLSSSWTIMLHLIVQWLHFREKLGIVSAAASNDSEAVIGATRMNNDALTTC